MLIKASFSTLRQDKNLNMNIYLLIGSPSILLLSFNGSEPGDPELTILKRSERGKEANIPWLHRESIKL